MRRRSFFQTMGLGSLACLSAPEAGQIFAGPQAEASRKEQVAAGGRDPWLEVNLGHISWNYRQIRELVKVPVMAVVKANAYGHGLIEVSRALERAGVDWLMVGKLQEAVALREAGLRSPILNFGPFDKGDVQEILGRDLSQCVCSDEARYLEEAAVHTGKKASIHIDVDTGMGRTGVSVAQALPLLEKLSSFSRLKIEGICTTLTEDPEFDRDQIKSFTGLCAAAEKRGIRLGPRHAASSAGILSSPEFFLDMVRPGITLYGYYPNAATQEEDRLGLRPALKFSAAVTFIRELQPGESLSYHRSYRARQRTRVATVGLGYSDGYAPQLAGKGFVLIKNKKYPVLEAVTANHMMIDLKDDREIHVGDEVRLIDSRKGSGLTADVLAELCGLSDYKLLIGLNPLLPKRYSGV